MKKYLLFLLFGFFGNTATTQNLQWAKRIGSSGDDRGFSVAVDASGNVYTTGWFNGTLDFDPGAGVFNLTSKGFADIFITKLDAAGNFVWAQGIGGSEGDVGSAIALDASGNVYISGSFGRTVDFDAGPGVHELITQSASSYFTMKLDGNGSFVWAHGVDIAPGYNGSYTTGLAVDANGNVFTIGYYYGTADFDPGPGVANLETTGYSSVFILRMDNTGKFLWVKSLSGTQTCESYAVDTDPAGNVCLIGHYNGIMDFDPGPGVFELSSAVRLVTFILKLDGSGNFVWVKEIDGNSSDFSKFDIATDAAGNVYTTGEFRETTDFDPGSGSYPLTPNGGGDIFISKLDASGNFVWAKNVGGQSSNLDDFGSAITVDPTGNVYTTGYFYGTADFDPGTGTFELSSAGGATNPDIFILKLDAAGNFASASRLGGTLDDEGNAIAADPAGNIYVTGYFNGTADFDPGSGFNNLVSAGNQDAFIIRFGSAPLQVNLLEFSGRLLNGNGLLSWKTDQERSHAGFEIERSIDGRNYKMVNSVLAANTSGVHSYSFTDAGIRGLGTNIIYYRLKQKDLNGGYVFSRIIALAMDGKNTVIFYPNPAKTVAGITITIDKASTVMGRITDNTGRLLLMQQWQLPAGSSSLSLDLSRLPAGTYIFNLAGSNIHETKKFNKE